MGEYKITHKSGSKDSELFEIDTEVCTAFNVTVYRSKEMKTESDMESRIRENILDIIALHMSDMTMKKLYQIDAHMAATETFRTLNRANVEIMNRLDDLEIDVH